MRGGAELTDRPPGGADISPAPRPVVLTGERGRAETPDTFRRRAVGMHACRRGLGGR